MSYGKSNDKKERHLSLDEVQYFERAMDAFADIKTPEEALDFFQPINEELKGKELLIAKNKVCSLFLDEYIKQCPNTSLERLFRAFSTHFEDLSKDKYASHNVENLINQTLYRLESGDQDTSFNELLASFVTELTPVAADLADDPSGTHVIRSIFNTLSKYQSLVTRIDKLARKIIQSFVQSPYRIRSTYFSATVQCISSLDPERYGKLLKYLLSSVPFQYDDLCDKCSSKLIESLIISMGKSATTEIYNQTLNNKENLPQNSLGRAVDCAFDPIANYVLQKWLEFCKDQEQLIAVIGQLIPKVDSLLGRKPQVVVSMSKGAILTNHKIQKKFYDILVKYSIDSNIVEFFVGFKPPNGSKILQNICYFDKSVIGATSTDAPTLVNSVLKLGGGKVAEVAADKGGSYFVSDFLKSESIDLKIRKKIIRRILPSIGNLSTDTFGRYVVEKAFNLADIQLKTEICQAIADAAYGAGAPSSSSSDAAAFKDKAKIIWKNLRMDQFISRRNLWLKDTENIMKRQEAMGDIINDESIPDVKPLAPKAVNVQEEISEVVNNPEAQQAADEIEQVGSLHKRRKKHRHHNQEAEQENADNQQEE